MSTTVEATIRHHLQTNDSRQAPIGRAEIIERTDTETRTLPVPVRGRGHGAWVAAGAAVVTLLLVGGVSLLTHVQDTRVADSVTPTTIVAPSVVVPPTIASLDTEMFPVWTRVLGPEGATSEGLLTTDGNGYIYCGSNFVATSPNGVDWERTEINQPFSSLDLCTAWDGVVVNTTGGGTSAGEGQPIVANPSFVEVSHPGSDVSSFRIDGDITSRAIGGTGILIATIDNRLDPMVIAGLTPEEEEEVVTTTVDDGILTIEFTDGTTRSVNLDELGIDPGDIYKTSWWFSEDGINWTLQPNEKNLDSWQTVGTELGFYAINSSNVWFTSDGVSWEEIGTVKGDGRLTRSGGKAIFASPAGFYTLNPSGLTEYVLNDLPPLTMPVVAGEDGVLAVQHGNGEESELKLFYAIPGQSFELEDIPPEMEAANESVFFSSSYAAFGNRYLLFLFDEDFVPSFWIKDAAPN